MAVAIFSTLCQLDVDEDKLDTRREKEAKREVGVDDGLTTRRRRRGVGVENCICSLLLAPVRTASERVNKGNKGTRNRRASSSSSSN